jgi:8-oxo-dGTP diphosphatase
MATMHVVIGIIIDKNQKILIAQRLSHQEKGGLWEFPGGKVEANEVSYAALQREFQEEIGIDVTSATLWMQVTHEYPTKTVALDVWMITEYLGVPSGAEGQPILWITRQELINYEFPEGNRLVIKRMLNETSADSKTNDSAKKV